MIGQTERDDKGVEAQFMKQKNFSIISLQYAYFTNNSFCGYSGL